MTPKEHNVFLLTLCFFKKSNHTFVWGGYSLDPNTSHSEPVFVDKCPGVAHSTAIACPPSVPLRSIRREINHFRKGRRSAQVRSLSKHETIKITDPWKPINLYKSCSKIPSSKIKNIHSGHDPNVRFWFHTGSPRRSPEDQDLVVSNPIAPKGEGSFCWYAESQQFFTICSLNY